MYNNTYEGRKKRPCRNMLLNDRFCKHIKINKTKINKFWLVHGEVIDWLNLCFY